MGDLVIKAPNTAHGQRFRIGLSILAFTLVSYFGITFPLTVRGDYVWAIFGEVFTILVGYGLYRDMSTRHRSVYRLVASLIGSAYAFLRENDSYEDSLGERCDDFDERLAVFVDNEDSFVGLDHEYAEAMADLAEERESLTGDLRAYLNGLKHAVTNDRNRLKFVDGCSTLAELRNMRPRRQIDGGLHAMRGLARVLENEQVKLGMPKHFLSMDQPLPRYVAPTESVEAAAA